MSKQQKKEADLEELWNLEEEELERPEREVLMKRAPTVGVRHRCELCRIFFIREECDYVSSASRIASTT